MQEEEGYKIVQRIKTKGSLFKKVRERYFSMFSLGVVFTRENFRNELRKGKIIEYSLDFMSSRKTFFPLMNGWWSQGPMAIFNNLKAALEFLEMYKNTGSYLIFKCKYTRSGRIKLFWRNDSLSSKSLPEGTVLANEVTLIEKVNL